MSKHIFNKSLRSFYLGVLVRDGHDPGTKLSKRWLCRGQSEWVGEFLL
jgi:hypothetical protein